MGRRSLPLGWIGVWVLALAAQPAPAVEPRFSAAQVEYFEKAVRPLLVVQV